MKKTLLSLAILLAAGSANAAIGDFTGVTASQERARGIEQIKDKVAQWENGATITVEEINAGAARINSSLNDSVGGGANLHFSSVESAARWVHQQEELASHNGTGTADNSNAEDNGSNDNNNAARPTIDYVTPAQAQQGDNNTMAYADAVSDHAEAAAEGYTDNAVAEVREEAIEFATAVADSGVNSAKTYADDTAAEAKKAANAHADQTAAAAEKHASAHADKAASTAETHAKTYTNKAKDEAVKEADDYAEKLANSAVTYSTTYADHAVSRAGTQAVKSANAYTDHVAKGLQKQITSNKRAIKRLGASSQATANLHYNANRNGYAVAVGEYNGETALAGGIQFNSGKHTAVTVQGSYDAEAFGGSVGLHGDW